MKIKLGTKIKIYELMLNIKQFKYNLKKILKNNFLYRYFSKTYKKQQILLNYYFPKLEGSAKYYKDISCLPLCPIRVEKQEYVNALSDISYEYIENKVYAPNELSKIEHATLNNLINVTAIQN